jgi:hypothetical protein
VLAKKSQIGLNTKMRYGETPGYYLIDPGDHSLSVEALWQASSPETAKAMEDNGHPDHEIPYGALEAIRQGLEALKSQGRDDAASLLEKVELLEDTRPVNYTDMPFMASSVDRLKPDKSET